MRARKLLPCFHRFSADEAVPRRCDLRCGGGVESLVQVARELQILHKRRQLALEGQERHPHLADDVDGHAVEHEHQAEEEAVRDEFNAVTDKVDDHCVQSFLRKAIREATIQQE